MNIPFDIEKYNDDKLHHEMDRFFKLYYKYKDDIAEILEFAKLYIKFVYNSHNKYKD